MKQNISFAAAILLSAGVLSGCGQQSSTAQTSPENDVQSSSVVVDSQASAATAESTGETAFDLAALSNPFLGEWQSDIPSANATLTFDYKADGTFDYEMSGVPADQGGVGTGGYVVYGDMMMTWLDFEGASAYTYKVVDNDTIDVTELTFGENGEKVPGTTAPFTRVTDSAVNTEDVPFTLSNDFLGKWQSDIPSANTTLTFDYKTDGTFDYVMEGVPAEQGGEGTGCYIIYGDKQVTYLDFEGVASYSFEKADENTINVTELTPDGNGGFTQGNTTPFVRVE